MTATQFYITTAISYPNGRPHMGHAYEAIAADAIVRFQRLSGRDAWLVTGTDEHGLKMAQTARAAGRATLDLANEMSGYFREMGAKLNISFDRFVRTSDAHHHRASQEIWRRMMDKGDLYLSRYEGWYSVRDEAYYDVSELIEGEGGEKLSPQGTPVEWTEEESYFFRLSAYADKLLDLYEKVPEFIAPASRRNEMIQFVRGGLKDLSVSRTSFDWGVKVPGDEKHVMYVWLDALTAYISALGFPDNTPEWQRYWPANIHLIGKDIVRFHTVYWPAFLMSAEIDLPRQVFGHGFVLNKGVKMSKSLGNVVDPMELADIYGVDQLRYFLIRDVPFGQDGSYSHEAIVNRTNADLANSFGNLAQRSLSQIFKNLDGVLPDLNENDTDRSLRAEVASAIDSYRRDFAALDLSGAVEAWLRGVFACNQYIDAEAPWALKKTDPERMKAVLATLFVAIRDLAICISPVIPASANSLLDQMGIPESERNFASVEDGGWYVRHVKSGFRLGQPQGIFPRYVEPEASD
jgi:methionyl-tRNA synthetase